MTEHGGLSCFNCGNEWEHGRLGYDWDGVSAREACPRCGIYFTTPPEDHDAFDQVVCDPEEHPRFELGHDEVRRRLPTVTEISDRELREEVIRLTANVPPYFWITPASTSKFHHPQCRRNFGLWAHTLMGTTALLELADTYVEQDRLEPIGVDYALAASILHDQRKNGPRGATPKSESDHDLQMARVIEQESDLPQVVADAVASHMGAWYDGPEPETPVERLVHQADMMASTPNVTPGLPTPVHDVLEKNVDLPEADL